MFNHNRKCASRDRGSELRLLACPSKYPTEFEAQVEGENDLKNFRMSMICEPEGFPLLDIDTNMELRSKRPKHMKETQIKDKESNDKAQDTRPLSSTSGWRGASMSTVLVIRVKCFDSVCEHLSLTRITTMAAELYALMLETTSMHGVEVFEPRRNCFVCVLTCDSQLPSASECKRNQLAGLQVRRMLALAADIHNRLHDSTSLLRDFGSTGLQMGMACGAVALMATHGVGVWTTPCGPSVWGDAVDVAQEMAEAGVPGTVAVHQSALWRWAVAARRLPPPSELLESGRGWRGRAGAFDLEACAFRPPSAAAADASQATAFVVPPRPRRSASFAL
jgi:class 3 adenylate cyclase